MKQELIAAEKSAKDVYLESKTKIGSAEEETKAADKSHKEAEQALEKANGNVSNAADILHISGSAIKNRLKEKLSACLNKNGIII